MILLKKVKLLATRKIQLYVTDTDTKLAGFLDSIEREAPDAKGYLGTQVKEILRAWSGLVELYGERDVLTLALQLASGNPPKPPETAPPTVGERGDDQSEVGTSPTKKLGGLGKSMYRTNKKTTSS
jgi:hypothetical protein